MLKVTTVGSIASFPKGPESNAQLNSEYTIIPIKTEDYPNDAELDFRVQAAIGYYIAWGRTAVILGYDFYGQESDWSNTQTLTMGNPQTPTPAPPVSPTAPASTATPTPTAFGSPTSSPAQTGTQSGAGFKLTWEEVALAVAVVVIAALAVALVLSRRKKQ
jgi:hypothetical protein